MKTIVIKHGEERREDLSGMKCFWLSNLTPKVKGDELIPEVRQYTKPTYPSEFNSSEKIMVRYNYDGLMGSFTWDPETQTLAGKGYGWETLTLIFE